MAWIYGHHGINQCYFAERIVVGSHKTLGRCRRPVARYMKSYDSSIVFASCDKHYNLFPGSYIEVSQDEAEVLDVMLT